MSQKSIVKLLNTARHVGIIMDGNRRWAKAKGLNYIVGHKKGAETAKNIINAAIDIKIQNLTLYAFSSENWKRDPEEVQGLISLLRYFLKNEIKNLIKSGVKLRVLGDLSSFEDDLKKQINTAVIKTKENSKINLIIAINYGSRQEITNCIKVLLGQVIRINITELTAERRTELTKNIRAMSEEEKIAIRNIRQDELAI